MTTIQESSNTLLLPERRRITALQNKAITERNRCMAWWSRRNVRKQGLHWPCSDLQAGNEEITGDVVHAPDMLFRMMENGRKLCCRGDHSKVTWHWHAEVSTTQTLLLLQETLPHLVRYQSAHFLPHHLPPSFSNDHLSPTVWQQSPRISKHLQTFLRGLALIRSQSICGWKRFFF